MSAGAREGLAIAHRAHGRPSLSDARLDLVIVTLDWATLQPSAVIRSVSSMRALRLMRPLASVRPGVDVIMRGIWYALPLLGDIFLFSLLSFCEREGGDGTAGRAHTALEPRWSPHARPHSARARTCTRGRAIVCVCR